MFGTLDLIEVVEELRTHVASQVQESWSALSTEDRIFFAVMGIFFGIPFGFLVLALTIEFSQYVLEKN